MEIEISRYLPTYLSTKLKTKKECSPKMRIWQLVVFEICTKVIRGTIYLGTYAKVYTRRSLFAQSLSMSHPSGFGIRQVLLIRAGGLPIWSTFFTLWSKIYKK